MEKTNLLAHPTGPEDPRHKPTTRRPWGIPPRHMFPPRPTHPSSPPKRLDSRSMLQGYPLRFWAPLSISSFRGSSGTYLTTCVPNIDPSPPLVPFFFPR